MTRLPQTSRIPLSVVECLWYSRARWVSQAAVMVWLVDHGRARTFRDLRRGPDGSYQDYIGDVFATLAELGVIDRDGFSMRFGRFLVQEDFEPVNANLPSSGTQIDNDQEVSDG